MPDAPALPSYGSGLSEAPLLGDTIGDNFDRTVAAHGDREALVDRSAGRRWTYRELAADVDALALGLLARASARATGSASGRRTAPSGRSCSTPPRRSARSWSTSTRPTASHELEYVLNQAGVRTAGGGAGVQDVATTPR